MQRAYYKSPLGWVKIEAGGNKITCIDFVSKPRRNVTKSLVLKKVFHQMEEYFNGRCRKFTFKLSFNGTAFQKKVWGDLQKIDFGKTVSYQELASRIGRPKAVRAAATAIGRNPAAIVVPCHRVIASSGAVGGYAGGVWRKQWLLKHEKEPKK